MWKIKHIFDGDYGCEDHTYDQGETMVSVTLVDQKGEEKYETVADAWLRKNHLDVGSEWPDYSNVRIETKDLVLKKAVFSDWKDIYENLWSHAESARYMLWKPTLSEAEAKDRMNRTLIFQKYHKYALFVYDRITGKAIGFAGMKDTENGAYEETGIAIGPDYVGRGYGTQILNALVEEAKTAGGTQFFSACRKQNIASHQLQMKCGFTFSHYEECIDKRDGEPYVLEHNVKNLV